jgi:hypothetical protein
MADDTDFAALYRELGIDPGCSLVELRRAWRRRVSKLHPDQGGDAEDTGRLQDLNRLYDAATDFHARYGRMPGAPPPGQLAAIADETPKSASWRRADLVQHETPAAGFGRISRYFIVVTLIAIAVLAWRVADRTDTVETESPAAGDADGGYRDEQLAAASAAQAVPVAQALTPGMAKHTVRDILGEPLDMHAMRWSYGPSWVDFRCDRVVGWYSSPLRPLPVSVARADAPQAADDRCD